MRLKASLAGSRRGAQVHEGNRDRDGVRAHGRSRRVLPLRFGARLRELAWARSLRALERRAHLPGRHHQSRNSHLRKLLVEASWHYTRATKERKRSLYDEGVPASISNHAAAGVKRLAERRRHLSCELRKRPVVANVATARELACWIWALGRMSEGALAQGKRWQSHNGHSPWLLPYRLVVGCNPRSVFEQRDDRHARRKILLVRRCAHPAVATKCEARAADIDGRRRGGPACGPRQPEAVNPRILNCEYERRFDDTTCRKKSSGDDRRAQVGKDFPGLGLHCLLTMFYSY